jgi:hypothetical protein
MLEDQYCGGLTKGDCKRNGRVFGNDGFLICRILI